jgi:hypothetical protein
VPDERAGASGRNSSFSKNAQALREGIRRSRRTRRRFGKEFVVLEERAEGFGKEFAVLDERADASGRNSSFSTNSQRASGRILSF